MNRALGIAAIVVAVASAGAHLLTFIGRVPISMSQVWPLHVLTMLCFASMVFVAVNGLRKATPNAGGWVETQRRHKQLWAEMAGNTPRPLRILFTLLFMYAFVNFGLFLWLSEGGNPAHQDGKYVLVNHGQVIREITEAEHQRFEAYVVRGVSGHWMVFSAAPAMFFLVVWPRFQQTQMASQRVA